MATQVALRKQTRPSLFWMKNTGSDEVTLLSDGVVIGRDPAACGACGAAARCRGAFCHRCGARLTGR